MNKDAFLMAITVIIGFISMVSLIPIAKKQLALTGDVQLLPLLIPFIIFMVCVMVLHYFLDKDS